MTKKYTGTVQGNTIQLDESSGLTDGDRVEVVPQKPLNAEEWEEKARKLAGILSDLPDSVDDQMEEILADRKNAQYREGS